ncbi:hypothetical protein [Methylicorpusculum sp.]|uniref:hypothetical protein n=1 Tax=Methylicorpusculum sp. TaxID=2713644 RepID=UPI00271C75C7|nr:hypothetical protein [Methylicorpusculum sp.]MDO8843834.1 hypothetical protein [Methylicorpusculum sp.]
MSDLTKKEILEILDEHPWGSENLRIVYFRDFQNTHSVINELPGGIIYSELKSLRLSLKIFLDAVDDLISSINKFKYDSAHTDFWTIANKPFTDKIEVTIQRGIISSSMCAMALVDHSREFNKKYPVNGYEDQIRKNFQANEVHKFVHGLRRFLSHIKFTKANWNIFHSETNIRNVVFILSKDDLMQFNDWSSLAKSYIQSQEDGVDVESLFNEYSNQVKKFHNWLWAALFNGYGEKITQHLNYLKIIEGFSLESNWNLLLQQVLPQQKIDPYQHLDKYLTDEQLEDIYSFPFRSQQQVDRIIQLIDTHQICTGLMRSKVYDAFNINKT